MVDKKNLQTGRKNLDSLSATVSTFWSSEHVNIRRLRHVWSNSSAFSDTVSLSPEHCTNQSQLPTTLCKKATCR